MKKAKILFVMGVMILGLKSVTYADIFNLSDNGWSITVDTMQQIRGNEGTPSEGLVNWNDPSGYDYVYQDSWWGRDSTAASEGPLSSLYLLSSSNPTINSLLLNFKDNGSLYLDLSYELYGLGNTSAVLEKGILTNKGTDPLTFSLFKYADYDLTYNYSAHDDDYVEGDALGVVQYDAFSSIGMVAVSALPPDAYQISAASGPGSIISSLNDSNITNLTNTSSPFGPGDASFALQWSNIVLEPNQPFAIQNFKILNTAAPEPVSCVLFLVGTGVLALARKKNHKNKFTIPAS